MAEDSNNSNPKIVFQIFGCLLILSSVGLVALGFWLKLDMHWYHVAMVALPSVMGLALISDKFRDKLTDLADKLPFIPYSKP